MKRAALGFAAAAALGGATAACIDASSIEFSCMSDAQCDLEEDGACVEPGWCAYPDDSCRSQLRFDPSAGDGLSSACVEPQALPSSG